jgi:hypothetical protein
LAAMIRLILSKAYPDLGQFIFKDIP